MTGPGPDERPQRRREYSGAGSTLGLAALVVVAVGVAIWYFELRGDGAPPGDARYGIVELAPESNPTDERPAAQEGRAAPDFLLRTVEDGEGRLSDFRGDYVFLNFWATWCPPCRAEIPALQEFFDDNKAEGVVVVGVNQQEQAEEVLDFLQPFGVTYPQMLDSDGEVSNGYRVSLGLPITFLIDPQGVILTVHLGPLTVEQMEELLAEYRV